MTRAVICTLLAVACADDRGASGARQPADASAKTSDGLAIEQRADTAAPDGPSPPDAAGSPQQPPTDGELGSVIGRDAGVPDAGAKNSADSQANDQSLPDAPADRAPDPSGPVPAPWRQSMIAVPPPDAGTTPDGGISEAPRDATTADRGASEPGVRADESGTQFLVPGRGLGANPAGFSDEFLFVHRDLFGDGSLTARIELQPGCAEKEGLFGLMMRASLGADAPYIFAAFAPTEGFSIQVRFWEAARAPTLRADRRVMPPGWLRVARSGALFTAAVSVNGRDWEESGRVFPAYPATHPSGWADPIRVGLVASAGASQRPCTAKFSSVTFRSSGTPDAGIDAPKATP